MPGAGIKWVDKRIPGLLDEMAGRLMETDGVVEAWLFGSWAWGTPTPRSDIDLLVIVDSAPRDPKARRAMILDILWDLGLNLDLIVLSLDQSTGNRLVELARKGRRLV